MEELFVIDDLSDGSIKVVQNLKDIKHRNFIVNSKITGKDLKFEAWGTTANEVLHIKERF